MLISNNHHIYWVKLVIQKIIQSLLKSSQSSSAKDGILGILNIKSESEALKQSLSYLNTFKTLPMTQEFKQLVVENTLSLL